MNNQNNHQMNKENTGSILGHFLIFFAIILLAVFLYFSIFSNPSKEQEQRSITLDAELIQKNELMAKIFGQVLEKRLDKIMLLGTAYSSNRQIRTLIEEENFQGAQNLLVPILKEDPTIEKVFIVDILGIKRASYPNAPELIGTDFSHRDWYQGVTFNFKPYLSEVYERLTFPQYNIITMAFPVFDNQGIPAAIIGLQIKLDKFYEWINEFSLKNGNTNELFIVDQKGKVIAHPSFPPQGGIIDYSDKSFVKLALRKERGTELISINDSNALVSFYTTSDDYGWIVFHILYLDFLDIK